MSNHHSQRIPATTQSNPRYWSTQNSFFSDGLNSTQNSFSKLHFAPNTAVNQSFDSFTSHNDTSFSHSKPRRIPSKNKWNHTFSIPIACGKSLQRERFEPNDLFADPHCSRLQTTNHRSIVCGGLKWDIYIHPNQGQRGHQFALSVFPVKSHVDDAIPANYKLSYTVTTALNPSPNSHHNNSNDDDQKAVSRFDHRWTREISEVVYDANPLSSQSRALAVAGSGSGANANGHPSGAAASVDWKTTMERLPFSTQDLSRYNDDDDTGDFNLYVSIQTRFVKQANTGQRAPYYGVIGAILLQAESEVTLKEKHISDLENHRDEMVQTLQTQLRAANESNASLMENNTKLSSAQQTMMEDLRQIRGEIEQVSRRQQEQKERSAEEFAFQLEARQKEIERLHKQIADLKEHSKQLLFQMANQQTLFDSQVAQQRSGLQQQWMQQNAQLLTPQHPAHLLSQHAPPPPRHNAQPVHSQAPQPPLQAQPPLRPVPPQPASASSSQASNQMFAAFTAEPPQPSSSYRARVISQPNWSTYTPPSNLLPIADTEPVVTAAVSASSSSAATAVVNEISMPSLASRAAVPSAAPHREEHDEKETHAAAASALLSTTFTSLNIHSSIGAGVPSAVALPQLEQVEQQSPQKQQAQQEEKIESRPEQPQSAASARSAASSSSSSNTDSLLVDASVGKASPLPAVKIAISDSIDADKEEQIFDAPSRAWRFDSDQEKWRGRGRGHVYVFYHSEARMAKLVFRDTKHNKNRLLQWIDGEAKAARLSDAKDEADANCMEWVANDYVMDLQNPMYGSWKLSFLEQKGKADQFVALFNKHLALQTNANGNECPHVDEVRASKEDDEKAETVATEAETPFAFSAATEAPKESFAAGMDFKFGSGTDWADAFGNLSQKHGNPEPKADAAVLDTFAAKPPSTPAQVGSSFEDLSMWTFNTSASAQSEEATAGVDTVAAAADGDAPEEDNGVQCTFKPIAADLKEQHVESGHEHEQKLAEFAFLSLYRWGQDVSGCKVWKKRATKSTIAFYENGETRKIRLTAREEVTSKLRLNQLVSKPDKSQFCVKPGGKQTWQWFGYDETIAAEEDDENAGFSQWVIRTKDEDAFKAFGAMFEKASAQNASVASPTKAIKIEAPQQQQPQQPVVDKIVAAQSQDDGNEEYKGWTQEEIALDKDRREKATKDAETAKLFGGGGGDSGNAGGAAWSMDAFGASQVGDFGNLNFAFDENQRGVDLEAEKELNRYGAPTNIQFGVNAAAGSNEEQAEDAAAQDFSNVTTRENKDVGGGLGLENFSFVSASNDTSAKNDAQENVENTGVSGWGSFSGGFSSVQATDGFANVQWGNSDEAAAAGGDGGAGFGSFGNFNADFSFGDLVSGDKGGDAAPRSQPDAAKTDNDGAGAAAGGNDGDDNCQQITFKPIVDLQEVNVESGHENEKAVGEFEVMKLYRWGQDVTSNWGWKTRASNTKILFYQNAESGKVRIVCRESVTSKLRLNQLVTMNFGEIEKKSAKQLQWKAIDSTIAEEDDKEGFCMFAAKFKEPETAEQFSHLWTKFAQNNAEING